MKRKVKYAVYSALYTILWMCSYLWVGVNFEFFIFEPSLLRLTVLIISIGGLWLGICGMTRNVLMLYFIIKLSKDKKKECNANGKEL